MKSLSGSKQLKSIFILLLCVIAVAASLLTSGLITAVIELLVFATLLWLVLSKPYIDENVE
ncbi:hypothetical protein ACFOD0_10875 [Shewanella intestini]|uniref:Uncharacterized protein n=1 Tax=Shewanella intestini TaxID=2017544 RepID=A0ABS5I3N4_9GAMM|nr:MULTISPECIES: hypothetical protein [Shewanella]MBR9728648.1 hypothetical protein [Shewanella intestini]MRG37296.1 hypothetical protein [Shewanella sp. XMDDZSB0408]